MTDSNNLQNAIVTLYHNPRCSKSRTALNLLQEAGADVHIILYLEHAPKPEKLAHLQQLLGCPVRDMLRATETIYQELALQRTELSDAQLLQIISEHPQLLQRPIVVTADKAVIARPPERVHELLQ
ncbi:MAG: arsenate reductase (glutaredoxin) [Gammaproteobacteria bacterium]|jgi:arsenate reductase|nr:arsenate reductase (glutaredoxin) [Gammaproteobacteria bacterium]